jgi:hypothetical protein
VNDPDATIMPPSDDVDPEEISIKLSCIFKLLTLISDIDPDIRRLPDTINVWLLKVIPDDAVAAFNVPSLISILPAPALFMVLNPIPEVPDDPDVPEDPEAPDEPV